MSASLWLSLIVVFLYVPDIQSSNYFTPVTSFEHAVDIINEVCEVESSCEGEFDPIAPRCCKKCSCAESCFESGTCCLGMYGSFSGASHLSQSRRFSCLLSQYLSYEQTDFPTSFSYVVVTACDTENSTNKEIYMCETPGSDLETVVPVTEPVSNVHYRNKYCAYCNSVDKSDHLISWKLWIYSNQYISVPRTDLLEVIRRTRGNIVFMPPDIVEQNECHFDVDYTIGSCNQTGLWQEYDELTEIACESYLFSFNYTYKNFFCFLCNSERSIFDKGWKCTGRVPNHPEFSAVYNLNVIMEGKTTDSLVCSDTQFPDEKMVILRLQI